MNKCIVRINNKTKKASCIYKGDLIIDNVDTRLFYGKLHLKVDGCWVDYSVNEYSIHELEYC